MADTFLTKDKITLQDLQGLSKNLLQEVCAKCNVTPSAGSTKTILISLLVPALTAAGKMSSTSDEQESEIVNPSGSSTAEKVLALELEKMKMQFALQDQQFKLERERREIETVKT
eukprot:GHVT01049112.1.p1 GENE.GHVT01049112.1~~GHVT01049112.1.p1  ORF type:complete len:115 (+),score=8.01 GHVT01049112.1:196-540(+)